VAHKVQEAEETWGYL